MAAAPWPGSQADDAHGRRRCVGGGLAGITAALRCADAGRRGDAVRGAAAAGRARPTRSAAASSTSTTGSTCSCAAAPPTGRCSTGSASADQVHAAGPARHPGAPARAAARPGCAAPACPRRCTSAPRCCGTARSRPAAAAAIRPGRAGAAQASTAPTRPLDAVSFGDWLRRARARTRGPSTRCGTWSASPPSTRRADEAVAGPGRDGVPGRAARPTAARPTSAGRAVPLGELHGDAAARRAGRGRRRPCAPATKVDAGSSRGDGGCTLRLRRASRRPTVDQVVLRGAAARPRTALAPPDASRRRPAGRRAGHARRSSTSTWCYDRRVLDRAVRRGRRHRRSSGSSTAPRVRPDARGQYLAVSLSAADDLIDLPAAELRERLLPDAGGAASRLRATRRSLDFFVTRERAGDVPRRPRAAARCRPPPTTRAAGLFLAGAWTDTGWPATMEGAVRSGDAAADAVLPPRHRAHGGSRTRMPPRPHDPPLRRAGRAATWSSPRCARPSAGSTRPAALRRVVPPRLDRRRRHARRAAAAARPCGPRWRCCPPRPPARRPAVALPGAVAVELVHNFSLLHDDLMDGDTERRHRPHGLGRVGPGHRDPRRRRAARAGHEVLLEAGSPRRRAGRAGCWPRTTRELTRGQAQDVAFETARRRDARRVPGDGRGEDRRAAGRERRDRRPCSPARRRRWSTALRDVRRRGRAGVPARRRPARASGATRR